MFTDNFVIESGLLRANLNVIFKLSNLFKNCVFCLALIFWLLPPQVHGQSRIDSLRHALKAGISDIEKVELHLQLAREYAQYESPEMIQQALLAKDLATRINYPAGLGKAAYLLYSFNAGSLHQDSLLALLTTAEVAFEEAELLEKEAGVLNQMGILYERQGKYRLALRCYYESLFIYQTSNDQIGIANAKNNIGLVHQLQKHYASAIYFFKQAIEIGLEKKDQDILANAYNNLAICYQEQKQPAKALDYFMQVYEIDKAQNIPGNLALSYNNLGVIESDLGNYAKAKEWLFAALDAKRSIDEFTGLANTYINLAHVYLKMQQVDSAMYFAGLAIKDARATQAYPLLADAYRVYSELLEKKNDLPHALQYRKLEQELKDSLSLSENQQLLQQHEEDFQTLMEEKSLMEVQAEAETSSLKNLLVLAAFVLVLLVVVFLAYYVVKVRHANTDLQLKQKKIEVQNKILQVKNIEVLQAKEAAEEAASIKGQFISTISHEIRTPLNAIIGVSNLLQSGNPKPDQLENLNILKISSENLLQLVNNILDFSKLEAGKLQLESIEFNLRGLVYDVKELFSIKAQEKGIDLMVNYDDKIPNILKGDPLRLNQLLINLVNNAIKFTDSGFVRIDVNIQLSTINHALVYFEVSDSGIGIPLAKQSQIFQSFTQADSNTTRKFGGTGLGLSICKRILENLNSKLQLESEVGEGSRFFFTLNFEVSRSASLGKSSKTASFEDSIRGKRILVVEDNMMNIMVIRQFLQKWGVQTDIALNGREGYKRLQEENYDAVLMDIHMPEMDGIEATKLIRLMPDERKRNVPIIALTAENEMQFRQKVYEVGMNDYIFKPFNPDDLRERLGYALYNRSKGINKFRREDIQT